jgi:hypothetical protein
MAFQSWFGEKCDYGFGIVLSEKQVQIAKKAAKSYDWEEDPEATYPQTLHCKKSGQIAIRRASTDEVVWDSTNRAILMLNIDEFVIKDVIV